LSKIEKIYNYLKECGPFYFASVEENKPRVRPFGFVMLFEDNIYFGMGNHKASYKQVVANPNIEICAMNRNGSFIRIKGQAVFDLRDEVQAEMFRISPGLANQYNEKTGRIHANFYLTDINAEICQKNTFTKIED